MTPFPHGSKCQADGASISDGHVPPPSMHDLTAAPQSTRERSLHQEHRMKPQALPSCTKTFFSATCLHSAPNRNPLHLKIRAPGSNSPRAQTPKGKENRAGGFPLEHPCHRLSCLPSPTNSKRSLELHPPACQLSDQTLSCLQRG